MHMLSHPEAYKSRTILTSDRDARETKTFLNIQHILDVVLRRENDRIRDKPVLVTLDGADHGSLRSSGLVVVDDTDTAQKLYGRPRSAHASRTDEYGSAYRHVDGHFALGDGIHRATHEGGLQDNVAGYLSLRQDV